MLGEDFWSVVAAEAQPETAISRWFCNRPNCNGEPHGPHWVFCEHKKNHLPSCRHARAAQVPPPGRWFVWMLLAGRGFGKSKTAAEWLLDRAWREDPSEWCVLARNAEDVRKNATDMTAGLVPIAKSYGWLRQYNRHESDIYLENGAVIHCLSADKPDRLRGFNLAGAWCDELASWRYAEATWDYGLLPALRAGSHPRVVVTTTPKPVPLIKRLVEECRAEEHLPLDFRSKVVTQGRTWDNAKNLPQNFLTEMRMAYEGTRMGRQELEGELLLDISGALVTPSMIEAARLASRREAEELAGGFKRVIVAVDPAGSYGEDSDETGIVVVAKGEDNHGYVLADLSCRASPQQWAIKAASAVETYQADAIAAEKNMGHGLVEATIRSVAPAIRYIPIQAQVGKRLRAEPITALYEQGRIHHVGVFAHLEDQLCSWTPDVRKSPDRMDALVHGFTELGLARWSATDGFLEMMRRQVETRGETDPRLPTLEKTLRRRAGATDRIRRRAQLRCQHRWFPDGHCAWGCGATKDTGMELIDDGTLVTETG